MSKAKRVRTANIRAEYRPEDFPAGLERGRYAERLDDGARLVRLEPDIAAAFPTSESVNEALAAVLKAARVARLPRSATARCRSRASKAR